MLQGAALLARPQALRRALRLLLIYGNSDVALILIRRSGHLFFRSHRISHRQQAEVLILTWTFKFARCQFALLYANGGFNAPRQS